MLSLQQDTRLQGVDQSLKKTIRLEITNEAEPEAYPKVMAEVWAAETLFFVDHHAAEETFNAEDKYEEGLKTNVDSLEEEYIEDIEEIQPHQEDKSMQYATSYKKCFNQ